MQRGKDLYSLKIDEEFRRLIPPLSAEERKQLEENILQDGCRDALCVWNKTIVDGHNRYKICTEHKIPFHINYLGFRSREQAIAWICANQLGRRNITDETRRYLIGKRYEFEKILGVANIKGSNQYLRKVDVSQFATHPKFDDSVRITKERLGREYHIDPATVLRYATYTEAVDKISEVVPELHEQLLSGQLKITKDNVIKMAQLSPSEIRRIGEEIENDPRSYKGYADTRGIMPKNTPHKVQLAEMQIGAIKDMPEYDPDAEIKSLALTIPSWVSSINRVRTTAKFNEATDDALKKLEAELTALKAAADTMLSTIREDN
ncbi:hypothetical protein FACS1894211_06780 [Clostridia bacterium]|nr:hypothetical protein FACS1894211_06780 [Clostridia bacterium]